MWGAGPCVGAMWGFWWVFPLIGGLVCLACIVMAVRFMTTGRGFSCLAGHSPADRDQVAELRREISTLREEIKQARAAG